ncbi:MAG TPA: S9 family peptidase [Phototrophicaceae bacterium]|nr:S9 family peptidase [Phototrophicaceae bacterium]
MTDNIRQYGTWSSPVTAAMVAGGSRINDVRWLDDTLIWHENRGSTGVLVAQAGNDAPRDLTSGLSVRGKVGYGGGEFGVGAGKIYFVASDGRLYRQSLTNGAPRPITPEFGGAASPTPSPDGKWVAFIHTYEGVDGLALVDSEGQQWSRKLQFGTDFAMQPVWHPDSQRLAYIAWNHPNMPWDGTELRFLTLTDDAQVKNMEVIAGDKQTAIFQPEFSPDGRYLSYISDTTGFGQLYLFDLQSRETTQITTDPIEHGRPAWGQGLHVYGWSHDGTCLFYLRNEQGNFQLWQYNLASKNHQGLDGLKQYTQLIQIAVSPIDDTLAVIASSSRIPPRLLTYIPAAGDTTGIRIRSRTLPETIPVEAYSEAQAITWFGHDSDKVYGLYYPPTSQKFTGTGTPPLIVYVHGGPTSQAENRFEAEIQFFATRGFAVLAVNHRGSTGYGKEYLRKLYGNWGYYDVEDSISGALHLVNRGLADKSKLVIWGGSAGGFTVLQALVDKPGVFRAGVCKFGVSNQFMLVQDTHKFEEQYSFSLLGNLPEAAELYRQRSPLFHAEKINDPVIVFQGENDTVVPRNQSDLIVASLKARNIPHEYHLYPGEGHGFRKPETIDAYLKAMLSFLQQYVVYA